VSVAGAGLATERYGLGQRENWALGTRIIGLKQRENEEKDTSQSYSNVTRTSHRLSLFGQPVVNHRYYQQGAVQEKVMQWCRENRPSVVLRWWAPQQAGGRTLVGITVDRGRHVDSTAVEFLRVRTSENTSTTEADTAGFCDYCLS